MVMALLALYIHLTHSNCLSLAYRYPICGPSVAGSDGLVLIEQVLRNSPPDLLRVIKYFCLGIAVCLSMIFTFIRMLAFQRVNPALWKRAIHQRKHCANHWHRTGEESTIIAGIFISRRMVFHTSALIASELYLIAMVRVVIMSATSAELGRCCTDNLSVRRRAAVIDPAFFGTVACSSAGSDQ